MRLDARHTVRAASVLTKRISELRRAQGRAKRNARDATEVQLECDLLDRQIERLEADLAKEQERIAS